MNGDNKLADNAAKECKAELKHVRLEGGAHCERRGVRRFVSIIIGRTEEEYEKQ